MGSEAQGDAFVTMLWGLAAIGIGAIVGVSGVIVGALKS